jgi:hypothetical protein
MSNRAVITAVALSVGALIVASVVPFVSCQPDRNTVAEPARSDASVAAPDLVSSNQDVGRLLTDSTETDIDDPDKDGWDTEVVNAQVEKQLKSLGVLAIHPHEATVAALEPLVAAEFACDRLLPRQLRTVWEDVNFDVQRGEVASDQVAESPLRHPRHVGAAGLADAVRDAFGPFAETSDARIEFKVFRISRHGHTVQTRQYVSASASKAAGLIEHHATWAATWQPVENGLPKLLSIRLLDFEQITSKRGNTTLFADCTEAVLRGNECYQLQLLRGMNHWLARIPRRQRLNPVGTPGLAVGDVNGDGLHDIYLCQAPGLPNRLFLQRPDGTLQDASDAWGGNWLEDSRSALLVDLDNDADEDLVVGTVGNVIVAANETTRFEVRAVLPVGEDVTALTAVDFDGDGMLDIHVCVNGPDSEMTETIAEMVGAVNEQFVYYDAANGGANQLFRNLMPSQRWAFENVTDRVGLDIDNRRWSLAAAWEDVDNDGDQDLYVANDYGPNNLFRNDIVDGKRVFRDVAADVGAQDTASGMSVSWADYNRDGRMDVHISNMFSAAGGRITRQPRFLPAQSEALRATYVRFARGNTLLQNQGQGESFKFTDVSDAAGITMGRWAWSSNFVDVNNDGWDDLVVANGYLSTSDKRDL